MALSKEGSDKSGLSLLDQLDETIGAIETVMIRLEEIKRLRAKDTRTLGKDSTAREVQLYTRVAELKTLLECKHESGEPDDPDVAHRLMAGFEKARSGGYRRI